MQTGKKLFILGAGFTGRSIAKEIREQDSQSEIVAFLDDDIEKIGKRIEGIPVLGPIADCASLLKESRPDEALIAIPSASRERLQGLYEILHQADFRRIRIIPSLSQIIHGPAHLVQARDIDPEDLLGRTPVPIDLVETLSYLRGKRVLLTGAGGSIGSELSRQLLHAGAERIYLLGHGENSIYQLEMELRRLQRGGVGKEAIIVPVIGELQDRDYIRFILKRLKADYIFHTAAHKHVPMMEKNPVAAIKNNVFGTLNLVEAAEESHCRLVLISTDKAVNPCSVYGASKKMAEMILLSRNISNSHFMVVRFGNVMGARGSILPLFKKQILQGGPVTITHPDMTRYYMTIPEAVSLVLKTAGEGTEGELYLLDMGEPLKIEEMARQMIRFYGYDEKQIPLKYIGLREGEKLEEYLWDPQNEKPQPTDFSRILRIESIKKQKLNIDDIIVKLHPLCFLDKQKPELYRNRQYLRQLLSEFFPDIRIPEDEPVY